MSWGGRYDRRHVGDHDEECQMSKIFWGEDTVLSVLVPRKRRAAGRFSVWLAGLLQAKAGRQPDASGAALHTRREVSGFPV